MKPITPLESYPVIAKELGISNFFLKREDLHPLGSHKGRSIPLMIDFGILKGAKSFAISSSGNAGLAAIKYITTLNNARPVGKKLKLSVFVGMKIEDEKLAIVKNAIGSDLNISISKTDRPLQALHIAERNGSWSLRQSSDINAPSGYEDLATELNSISELENIFLGTSSGTTAVGLIKAFNKIGSKARVNIVQTEACHILAEEFDKDYTDKKDSLAHAIVDKIGLRKNELTNLMTEGNHSGYIVSDEYIKKAQEILSKNGVKVTANGALSLAGLLKAKSKNIPFNGSVVCIIGGK